MAVFDARMATQNRICLRLFVFGVTTVGETHGVGPSAFSMRSFLRSFPSFGSTFFV